MLLGTLDARNLLTGKSVKMPKTLATRARIPGLRIMRAGEGTIKAGEKTTRAGQES